MSKEKVGTYFLSPGDRELITQIQELAKIEEIVAKAESYQDLFLISTNILSGLNGNQDGVARILGAKLLSFQFKQDLLDKADPQITELLMQKRGEELIAKIGDSQKQLS